MADEHDVPVLDDPDTTKLQDLLDQYTDPTTTSQALVRLNKFIEDKPDKFFLKLAVIFSSSQSVATRLARVSDLHLFLLKNLDRLDPPTEVQIKGILLGEIRHEENIEVIENMCNFISNIALFTRKWDELVNFVFDSLSNDSLRLQKISLSIIVKEPRILVKAIRPRKNSIRHGEVCDKFAHLMSTGDPETNVLALKAAVHFIVFLETRYRRHYKKLIPKFEGIMKYMVTRTGPRVQTSVITPEQQYVEAAELIELFLGMDNQNFFIGEVHDKAMFTKFIEFLFYLARAQPFFPRLRDSVLKLLAKFCATEHIHMEAHYLDIYDVLNRMMIEPADPEKWYKELCTDLDWAGSEYCSAVSLLDKFVPAGISVDAFLKAAEMTMDENMVIGDWCAKHAVMVVVAKLADGLIIQENRGVAPSDNLMRLLELARVPLKDENGRLQWASATAIAKIGEAMKAVTPELIKKFANGVISDLDDAYATCDTDKAQAAIKLASVIFST